MPQPQQSADSSALTREPVECPHCGEALPQEPALLEALEGPSQAHPETVEARYRPTLQRVEVFGGESGFTESDPLALEAERVGSAREALRWMGQVAAKPWARGRAFLRHLADALTMALHDQMEKRPS